MKLKVSLLIMLLVFCVSFLVYGEGENTVSEENSIEEEKVLVLPELVVLKEKEVVLETEEVTDGEITDGEIINDSNDLEPNVEKVLTFYNAITEEELFTVEDEEFSMLLFEISDSLSSDVLAGLENLSKSDVTLDHIKLKTWGEFLYKYYGKDTLNFPLGYIHFKFSDYDFELINNDFSKVFVKDTLIPNMLESIIKYSSYYPVKRYALQIDSGVLLKDYVCDLSSVREVKTVYPFDGVFEYIFFNAGSYYGISLGQEYVSILRGYIEGEETGYDRPIKGMEYPGCVNILSYITYIKNISDLTLSDKVLSDFNIYNDLAITLDKKELVDTKDMSTSKKELFYSDFKINPDNLILVPIKDTVVVLQPYYLECFRYGGVQNNFSRTLDITSFVKDNENYFTVLSDNSKVPIERFVEDNGMLNTELGNFPFLMFYTNYVPYDLLVNWAYNQSGGVFKDDVERRDAFVDSIRKDLKASNRSADFDAYMKAAGQKTDKQKLLSKVFLAVIVIVIIFAAVLFIIIRKNSKVVQNMNNNMNMGNQNLMFGDSDDDLDDDDDFDGTFELR